MSDFNSKIHFILEQSLRKWVGSIDLNSKSMNYGLADRDYWAWKVKDFPNGTHQAGLAAFLDCFDLLSFGSIVSKQEIVKATIHGSDRAQRSDGSFEEAYPYESSYAVTGLVQFNLLYCLLKHEDSFDPADRDYLSKILKKSQSYLVKTEETHGIISNHRASSELAIELYNIYFSEKENMDVPFFDLIKSEGWFPEYDGADPGYQTLLNHYLSAFIDCLSGRDLEVTRIASEVLQKSKKFVEAFIFPDGTFSGEIGSRGTSIVYPSGLIMCDEYNKEWFCCNHLLSPSLVSPLTVDSGNFIPVLNSWALEFSEKKAITESQNSDIDFLFKEANLYVKRRFNSYLAVNVKNGVIRGARKEGESWQDNSLVALVKNKCITQLGQAQLRENDDRKIKLQLGQNKFVESNNSLIKAIIIRIVGVLIYYFPFLQKLFKMIIIKYISGPQQSGQLTNIFLDIDKNEMDYKVHGADGWKLYPKGFFRHMASANTYRKVKK